MKILIIIPFLRLELAQEPLIRNSTKYRSKIMELLDRFLPIPKLKARVENMKIFSKILAKKQVKIKTKNCNPKSKMWSKSKFCPSIENVPKSQVIINQFFHILSKSLGKTQEFRQIARIWQSSGKKLCQRKIDRFKFFKIKIL